jgi:hypothetical protein
MKALRAKVEHGRLILDVPTTLPEGTVLDLVVDADGDDLSDPEREALHAALDIGWAEAQAGQSLPVEPLLERLRAKR